jgi:hypothetical protein
MIVSRDKETVIIGYYKILNEVNAPFKLDHKKYHLSPSRCSSAHLHSKVAHYQLFGTLFQPLSPSSITVIQEGTFYRLLSPFEGNYCAWMIVSRDKETVIIGYYTLPSKAYSNPAHSQRNQTKRHCLAFRYLPHERFVGWWSV